MVKIKEFDSEGRMVHISSVSAFTRGTTILCNHYDRSSIPLSHHREVSDIFTPWCNPCSVLPNTLHPITLR